MRDFPPLIEQNRAKPAPAAPPVEGQPVVSPKVIPEATPPAAKPAAQEPYRLGVGDELSVAVLGAPELSRGLKVRPDGAVTAPGAGTIFVLGRTPEEVGREIERKLDQLLRHPRVDLIVDKTSDHKVYVMGEVIHPGEVTYHPGMTVMQMYASAGGPTPVGKASSALLLRRTGLDELEVRRCNLTAALKGTDPAQDVTVMPYDILYLPATIIGQIDLFMDQYMRQMIAPLSLYIEGWNAYNISTKKIRYVTSP